VLEVGGERAGAVDGGEVPLGGVALEPGGGGEAAERGAAPAADVQALVALRQQLAVERGVARRGDRPAVEADSAQGPGRADRLRRRPQ
jgi:hypothetical protein